MEQEVVADIEKIFGNDIERIFANDIEKIVGNDIEKIFGNDIEKILGNNPARLWRNKKAFFSITSFVQSTFAKLLFSSLSIPSESSCCSRRCHRPSCR